ncbi:MAG: NAD-dependent epimerase/dehydratase family protein [Clostridiales Family XIII bacterium]|jgi:nucleoside-diphosphate-sugar epimerase|nr:NAD-dependent epimerase/dehydratase family protein [Clostridiales Family XIII bacterium]
MKKVVITGATGFIGGALAKRLLTTGVKVYGVGRNAEFKYYNMDVCIEHALEYFEDIKEYILHGHD